MDEVRMADTAKKPRRPALINPEITALSAVSCAHHVRLWHGGHFGVLILPMPTWLLDMSLAPPTLSVLILMTALFVRAAGTQFLPDRFALATMIRWR